MRTACAARPHHGTSRLDDSREESLRVASNAGLKRQSLTPRKGQAPKEQCVLLAVPSQVQAPKGGQEYVHPPPLQDFKSLTARSRLLCA
jgi:hypothetical protein